MSEHPSDEGRAASLLLKAIHHLPAGEQDEVLEALVRQTIGSPGGIGMFRGPAEMHPGGVATDPDLTFLPGPPFDVVKPLNVSLLVRLPEDLHDRFRRWCTDNGFSMASAARGLIERFLKDRTPPSSSASG